MPVFKQNIPSGEEQDQSETAVFPGQTKTHIKRWFMHVFNIPEEI